MIKHRNTAAIKAWNRKGGAHTSPKKPVFNDTEEGFEDYLEEKDEQQERRIPVRDSKQRKGSSVGNG